MSIRHFIFGFSLLLLAACAVGPDFERPQVETPAAFKEAGDWQQAAPKDDIDRGDWWAVYDDPVLDGLEKKIEISNQNLKAAEAAYRSAQAVVEESRATLFPTVSVNSSDIRSGSIQPGSKAVSTYGLNSTASWTADVWGRIRRTVESSEANAQASAADLVSARLSAQATLATDYFGLRSQDELQRLLDATVKADKKILEITRNQYKSGITAESDVLAAQTQLETVQAQAINAGVLRAQYEHAIAVLTGAPPSEFTLAAEPKFADKIPNVPTGMPSTLLERRPDVAAAERAVTAANAQIGVATAAWFPDLTLSASYGYSSVVLGKLLQASTNLWSFGPSLAETIFDAGAREAAVEQAKASYDESVATYRQTVLTAFQQVEDNLSAGRILADQTKASDAAVADARRSEQLTLNQYKEGIIPYNTVLTAQTTTLSSEQSALTVRLNRLNTTVALIQALGGGWSGLPHND